MKKPSDPIVFLTREEAEAWTRFYCAVRMLDGADWSGEADAALLDYRKRQPSAGPSVGQENGRASSYEALAAYYAAEARVRACEREERVRTGHETGALSFDHPAMVAACDAYVRAFPGRR